MADRSYEFGNDRQKKDRRRSGSTLVGESHRHLDGGSDLFRAVIKNGSPSVSTLVTLAKNPALQLPHALLVRIARLSLTHDNFEHSEEPHGSVERIISIRETLPYCVRQFSVQFDFSFSTP